MSNIHNVGFWEARGKHDDVLLNGERGWMINVPMSEYYQEIRGKVGSELLMMPSVAAVIRNKEDEILFIRKPEVIVFECSIIRGSLRAMDGEIEEFKFFKEGEPPEMTIPYPVEIFMKDREIAKTIFE